MTVIAVLLAQLLHVAPDAGLMTLPEVFSLGEAVQTALALQPQLRQARAGTEAALARADEARAPLLPRLDAAGTYSRGTANFVARPGALPTTITTSGGSSFRSFNYFTLGLTASQLIWDFGGSFDRWRSAQSLAEAQHYSEISVRLQTILTVQVAYFNAAARKDLVNVARETLQNQVNHLRQIEGFVRVGTRPEIDLAQARTDEANARVQMITSENNFEAAKAQLNQAVGVERSTHYDVRDETLPPFGDEDATVEQLLGRALKARPEFASLEQQVRAQRYIVAAVNGGYFPTLNVAASFTDNGPALDRLTWNWNAQLQLQWNLFQGFFTKAQSREALANLAGAESVRDIIRLQVRLEVEQSQLALRGAKAAVVAAGEALESAKIRLRLAERRYQTGVGDVIELGDAQVALTNAAAQEVAARSNVSIARAQLVKAIGGDI